MPGTDEQAKGGEAVPEAENQQDPENLQGQDEGELEGEQFDKERALETIRKQREAEKKAKEALKAAQARLAALEAEEKKRKDAELSELQKAQNRVAELETALKEVQEYAQGLRLQQAFTATAAKLNLSFVTPQAAEDAFELADLEGVEIDENGKVTGLDDALKALQKDRPYLFKTESGDEQGTPKRQRNGSGKLNTEALDKPMIRF